MRWRLWRRLLCRNLVPFSRCSPPSEILHCTTRTSPPSKAYHCTTRCSPPSETHHCTTRTSPPSKAYHWTTRCSPPSETLHCTTRYSPHFWTYHCTTRCSPHFWTYHCTTRTSPHSRAYHCTTRTSSHSWTYHCTTRCSSPSKTHHCTTRTSSHSRAYHCTTRCSSLSEILYCTQNSSFGLKVPIATCFQQDKDFSKWHPFPSKNFRSRDFCRSISAPNCNRHSMELESGAWTICRLLMQLMVHHQLPQNASKADPMEINNQLRSIEGQEQDNAVPSHLTLQLCAFWWPFAWSSSWQETDWR